MERNIRLATVLSLALLGPLTFPAVASAHGKEVIINAENFRKLDPVGQQRVLDIRDRLEAIAAMDRSSLTHEQKQALRTEVKGINKEMKEYNRRGTVIYLSTAGIIIIVLLLIILL